MIMNEASVTGWRRVQERAEGIARRGKGGGVLGLICLDLSPLPPARSRLAPNEAERQWNDKLRTVCPAENVWFADELSGHLWLYAETAAVSEEAAMPELVRTARRLRDAFGSHSYGEDGRPGFGVSALALDSGVPLKDAAYEAAIAAIAALQRPAESGRAGAELRLEMERLLRERSIRSVFQPISRLDTGAVFGYEALTRCPEGSRFDGPLALFQYAEREGYAFALDRLAREKAIRHSPALGEAQKIFINVTIGIMKDPQFVSGQTVQWLRQRGLHPGQVVLELTERSSIDDFAEAKKVLRHYRSQGYEIAIDDAGAGYSSLQSIVELEPDYIKVDKSLVQNADRDEMKKQMLRTFTRFARRMDIRTVAEGIERPEELRLARSLGVDFGQGYLLGRPGEYGAEPASGS